MAANAVTRNAYFKPGTYTRRHLLAGSAVAACGRHHQTEIAVIPKSVFDLFFLSVHAGAEKAAREAQVSILWKGPDDETDTSRQIQIVDAMIARRVDGIAISGTEARALAAPLEHAFRQGIPVTVFDSATDFDNYVSFVATDNHGAGCSAARALAALTGGRGNVGMVMQKPGGMSTSMRERGFEETMAKEFPAIRIAARQFGMGDRAKSRAAAENILTAHPELAGIFASSEAASIGSIQAIRGRNLSRKIKLITFDFSESHVEALKDGTIDAMFVQDPFRIGYEAVKSLTEKIGGRIPARRLDLPARMIVKSDLTRPEIQALLFPEWLKAR